MTSLLLAKLQKRNIDGVLLVDKQAGLSSHETLMRAKRIFNAKKAGHTGTLDPFATGLLPLCFGEATKFSQELLNADKTYETVVRLGVQTTTGDTEGDIVKTDTVPVLHAHDIEQVLCRFRGEVLQVPPMYSALKRDGRPLYEYARAGLTFEREARRVTIHDLVLLDYSASHLVLRVTCSKGTYIRVLGEDIGQALGCGAHLESLRRTQIGLLTLDSALTLTHLENAASEHQITSLKPVDYLLSSCPAVTLNRAQTARFKQGQRLSVIKEKINISAKQGRYRVYADEEGVFLGTAQLRSDAVLAPERMVTLSHS